MAFDEHLLRFQEHLVVQDRWAVSGTHYAKTLRAWLRRLDANSAQGSGGTDKGLAAVREHGADVAVNHRDAKYIDAIMDATGGKGVNLILEMAAHVNLDRDLGMLAKFGRVVVIGNRGRVEIDARQAMGRDAAILGMTLFNVTDTEMTEIHAALIAGLDNGTLNPLVGRELPLAEAAGAHQAVMEPGALGKIVLTP